MRSAKGRVLDAQLLNHGEYGTEVQFFNKGILYQSGRWHTRAEAIAEANEKRQELKQDFPRLMTKIVLKHGHAHQNIE